MDGRTILNNKGNPVKQYEPFFSTTHEYDTEEALQKIGVTPILRYDALGRHVLTEFPNGTRSRVAFDSWTQQISDVNDTVLQSPWWIARGGPDPGTQPEPLNDPERRAAWLTVRHAGTPATLHFDSVGRCMYALGDYGGGKRAGTRTRSDLTGRFTTVFDAPSARCRADSSAWLTDARDDRRERTTLMFRDVPARWWRSGTSTTRNTHGA